MIASTHFYRLGEGSLENKPTSKRHPHEAELRPALGEQVYLYSLTPLSLFDFLLKASPSIAICE